jgi:hypothetical protein
VYVPEPFWALWKTENISPLPRLTPHFLSCLLYIKAIDQLNIRDSFITKLKISQIHSDKSQQSEQNSEYAFLLTKTRISSDA